jgi:tetratricopeptide (TPR) repeat protein
VRSKLLPPPALLARLARRLQVLTGGPSDLPARQQTLRGAIEWSYDLLDAGEQQLFRRLAVFSGGCSPAAIEEVCNPQGLEVEGRRQSSGKAVDVLISAESLLTKSLLNAGPGSARAEGVASESRFWMLETIGEYARDRLRESGEEDELQRRHAHFYMDMAEEACRNLSAPTQQEWLDRLETEHANLLAALHWAISAVDNDPGDSEAIEIGLRLAGPLGRFWDWRGDYSQGRTELARVLSVLSLPDGGADGMPLAVAEGGARVTRAIGLVLYWAAVLAGDLGDDAAARELHEQALAIRRRLGDKSAIAESLGSLASVLMTLRDQVHGRSMLEESLALALDVGDHPAIARALRGLGSLASHNGDNPTATALIDEAWAIARETGDKSLIARLLLRRAQNAWVGGELVVSRSLFQESLRLQRELRDKEGTAEALFWLAFVAYLQSDYSTSKAEARESLILYREMGSMWGFTACLFLFGWLSAVEVERNALAERGKASGSRGQQQIVAPESAATPKSAERAARLLAAGALLAATKSPGLHAGAQPIHDRSVAVVRAMLGDAAFEQASLEGQSMTPEQAIEYALYEKR